MLSLLLLTTRHSSDSRPSPHAAQHHFRLAQQHLEAAQRLALAAVDAPNRYARSNQSSIGSSRDPHTRHGFEQDSASSSAYDDSSNGPDEAGRSPVSPVSSLGQDLRRLSINQHLSSSWDERRRASLSTAGSANAIEASAHGLPSPPPLQYSTSPSSISLRSAPALSRRRKGDGSLNLPQRPEPPPRRATVGASSTMPPFESASALVPSLYGGGVPPGVADRLGVRSASTGTSPSESLAVSRTTSSSSSSRSPTARSIEAGSSFPAAEEGSGGGAFEDDGDDGRSDFFDAQSTISHVTNSPLPSYADPYERPAVPSIPEQYMRPAPSAPPASTPGDEHRSLLPSPETPSDDFHGFRPRRAVSTASPQTRQVIEPFAPAASLPSLQPPLLARGPVYAQPVASLNGAQPHSYIMGADGQAIPVYSAPAGPYLRADPPAPRSTLPIHSQPLQFDHSLPYAQQSQTQAPRGPVITTAGVHPTLAAGVSPLQPFSPHASPIAPSILPALTSQPSTASFAPFVGVVPRPSSPSASSTTTHTARAPSISARSRMASLRAAVRSPHVRFMSPTPEARSRAVREPSEPDPPPSRPQRSGRNGSSTSGGAGARGRKGFFGATPSAGDALRFERQAEERQPQVPQVDYESEADRRKRQGDAIQQSLDMLL